MAFQTRNLVLTALGIENHAQPQDLYPEAPRVPNGIHLRWTFERELGFPWFGFYLFRRPHEPLPVRMLGTDYLLELASGEEREVVLPSPQGEVKVSSEQRLVPFHDQGIELSGRGGLRFSLNEEDPAQAVELKVAFRAPCRFRVTGILWGRPVVERTLEGQAGQTRGTRLEYDALTEVLVEMDKGTGLAALQDFGFALAGEHAAGRWEPLPGFPYPLTLPVEEGIFPYPGAPLDFDQALDVARRRIIYPEPERWLEWLFEMHEPLVALVEGGPGEESLLHEIGGLEAPGFIEEPRGKRMVERTMRLGALAPPGEPPAPDLVGVRPLDLLLLASLEPAVAQMLGLYWLDQEIGDEAYDYLIVADYDGAFEGQLDLALHRLNEEGPGWLLERAPGVVSAYIAFGRSMDRPAAPLGAPSKAEAYELPGNGMPLLGLEGAQGACSAGLRWEPQVDLAAGHRATRPVRYHVWRREDTGAVSLFEFPYECLTRDEPTLKGKREGTHPAGWPKKTLDYVDNGLAPGKYKYRVGGVDLFGRYSRLSDGAGVTLEAPKPAIPAPTAVEATALDPNDPYVGKGETPLLDRDEPHLAGGEALGVWHELPNGEVRVRVRWEWTAAHRAQAPGVERFRIHFQPGHLNALATKTGKITFEDGKCVAQVALPAGVPAKEYWGTVLVTDGDAFPITGAKDGSRVYVDCGPLYRSEGTHPITVKRGSLEVTAQGSGWKKEHVGLRLRIDGEGGRYTILDVRGTASGKQTLLLSRPYEGDSGARGKYTLVGKTPRAETPCSIVIPEEFPTGEPHPLYTDYTRGDVWAAQLGDDVGYDEKVVETIPPWRARDGYPLQGNGARVSGRTVDLAADEPDLTDLPHEHLRLWLGKDTAREGQTYRIRSVAGRTLTLYETPNVPGDVSTWVIGPPDPLRRYEVILAAPSADTFAGKGFMPALEDPIKYAHVAVGAIDSGGREGTVSAPATVFRVHRKKPVAPGPLSSEEREWASPADYHGRSSYAVQWTARPHLKAHVYRALDESLFQVDWEGRKAKERAELAADDSACLACFPTSDSRREERCKKIAGELNALNTLASSPNAEEVPAHYRKLSDGALRVLAGLPANAPAFTRITVRPQDGARYADTLDGRSTSRYFYRVSYVDGVQNESALGPSTPPVYLRNVVPPAAPVVTRILAGIPGGPTLADNEGKITLGWASNREADLASYRVYRTAAKEKARDVRLMEEVETPPIPVPDPDPAGRPNEVTWTDTAPPLLTTLYYRVVAVDTEGNVSAPSPAFAARAFKQSPPQPPTWVSAGWNGAKTAVELTWKLEEPNHRVRVQRWSDLMWMPVSPWLAEGALSHSDTGADPALKLRYRLQVRDGAGNTNRQYHEQEVTP